jgi:hypothetical protein
LDRKPLRRRKLNKPAQPQQDPLPNDSLKNAPRPSPKRTIKELEDLLRSVPGLDEKDVQAIKSKVVEAKWPHLKAYLDDGAHLRLEDEDGRSLRLVPSPYQKFERVVKKTGKGASGYHSEHEFPDWVHQEVEIMSWMGATIADLCDLFKINRETVEKHFQEAIVTGPVRVNYALARVLLQKAFRGDTYAAVYLTKARMGWTDLPRDAEVRMNVTDSMSVAVKVAPEKVAALLRAVPNLKEMMLQQPAPSLPVRPDGTGQNT